MLFHSPKMQIRAMSNDKGKLPLIVGGEDSQKNYVKICLCWKEKLNNQQEGNNY